jgi:hypothetical protein
MLSWHRMRINRVLKRAQFMAPPIQLPQIVSRTFAKASTMTFDDIAAEFNTANNLLDVQKISADLYSDQEFLGT